MNAPCDRASRRSSAADTSPKRRERWFACRYCDVVALFHSVARRAFRASVTAIVMSPGRVVRNAAARALGRKDPGQVVIDEVLGQWVTLLGAAVWTWKTYLAAFLLFRLFDIWKPPPVRQAEALPEGSA